MSNVETQRSLDDHVRRMVETAPQLTATQLGRLTALVSSGRAQAVNPLSPMILAGYAFEARCAATCPACLEDIEPGMDICQTPDATYVHAECVEGDRS
jgi:hypothetical protein